jgi:hypothetical protein
LKVIIDIGAETETINKLLRTFDDFKLFLIGLHSSIHWDAVANFLQRETDQPLWTLSPHEPLRCTSYLCSLNCWTLTNTVVQRDIFDTTVGYEDLPLELQDTIYDFLDIRGQTALAGTCRYYRFHIGARLSIRFAANFREWDLNWMSFKFMLRHTDNVLSGFSVNRLLDSRRLSSWRTELEYLDLYIWDWSYPGVSTYFNVATSFRKVRT